MTYILAWLLCSICSFYLLKTYITSNLSRLPSPPENIAQAMRNAAKRDSSDDVSYAPPDDCPDNVACALFWTILLVYNLVCWPFCLMSIIWWSINKQDFSDFRGL